MRWSFTSAPAWTLRELTASDTADCARWHAQTFARPWTDGEFQDLLANPGVSGFMARPAQTTRNGETQPGGFVLTRAVLDEAEILTVAVSPSAQGAGLGAALMEAALRALHTAGVASVFLEVDVHNTPALRLYARLGFHRVSMRPDYYAHDNGARSDAALMRLDLRQPPGAAARG
ncbi:MAG TPA: GNAT family N-acetyltransferase [Rhizobiaceae bacterium]|nr:GNAT family N-acetyltransferase [Rhizobiaceae bacterium]